MIRIIAVALALATGAASAGDVTDIGDTTRSVLKMQRKGTHSVDVKPMLKPIAERTYQRLLKSFTQPIPADFDKEGFSTSN